MSGHSKWHNIRLRKAKQDAVRGKLFTKLGREILVAARQGGGNLEANTRLRLAIEKARDASMPQDNIKRLVDRATGQAEDVHYQEVTYEGYGPGGVAVLVDAVTDNRNRTLNEIRNIFSRAGGGLGEPGSVAWMFTSKGVILVGKAAAEEDRLLEIALDAGADDLTSGDSSYQITAAPGQLDPIKAALQANGIPYESAELEMIPQSTVPVAGRQAEQVLRVMEELEEHDDVQRVHANFDIPDSVIEAMAA